MGEIVLFPGLTDAKLVDALRHLPDKVLILVARTVNDELTKRFEERK